jgi:hypothetical protein
VRLLSGPKILVGVQSAVPSDRSQSWVQDVQAIFGHHFAHEHQVATLHVCSLARRVLWGVLPLTMQPPCTDMRVESTIPGHLDTSQPSGKHSLH